MAEVEQPSQNGTEMCAEEDENSKSRPADIEQDMREMERRKRVEAIMGSKLFREELERIVDSQIREGGTSGILQQLSDIVGIPTSRVGNIFKSSNCVLPINDIRGVESMGYSKGEKILRCKLAATFRLLDLYGWTKGLGAQVTARLKVDQELFLVNPYGLLYHEVTASSLNKVDMQGNVIEQGTTNFGINKSHFALHSIIHAARPDIRCAIYIGCNAVVAVSSLLAGLLPLSNDAVVLGEISTHQYTGSLSDTSEREKLVRNLGPVSKVMLLTNHGALCCGETIEEAFFAAYHIVQACETQLKLLPIGIDNLALIPEESRKAIYDAARRPPDDLAAAFEKKTTITATVNEAISTDKAEAQPDNKDLNQKLLQQPKWRVGGAEFEALMRMLDNAGFRTGYIYRHPLIKSELPKPKNDVEVPPAVSSLGYLLEEEELYRQGIWKKGDWRKGGDRSRWLNSPNVYQKVEVLETGTPDPKKITKWVAEGSPTHSTPVRIEGALQFVPPGTNPKEFKKVQQQIKDNRRADKISAGPQSHILEGVTWDEANRIKDATVSSAGDHVVLMGAASKGIIQRGFQHNATVYKAPYAKNPFDNVTDDELNEYKRTVEKKKSVHGEYTDTDFSESEALSSLQTSGVPQQHISKAAVVSQSETEDTSEHQVMRIETKQAPVPSQPEVVLSDGQEKYSINQTSQNTVTVKVNQSFEIDEQEKNLEQLDGIDQQELYHPFITDNFLTLHSYFKELLQQNVHLKDTTFNNDQCEVLPLKLEITTSEFFPYEDCTSEFITPHICYPLGPSDLDSQMNDMVCNTQYARAYSFPSSTSSHKSMGNTCKPYRTLSHFGFNYPRFQTPPDHYHLPILPNKYVPLKKSLSYNEIFSSPRYVDLCDNCFEKVLHLRPDLVCGRFERRKLLDNEHLLNNDDENYEETEQLYEAVKYWIDGQQLNASRVLEPVIEVDEEDQASADISLKDCNSNLVVDVEESSTFLDKITRMNYSEESTNVGFQPSESVNSELGVEICDNNLTNEGNYLSLQKAAENNNKIMLLPAEQPFSDDRNADINSSTEVNSSYSDGSIRKLMTREERNQRKQEFTELWQDHIEYFTKKQLSDSDNESDLENNASEIFFGESRVSSTSWPNYGEEQNASTDSTSATFRISSPSSSCQALHSAPSLEFYSFADKESNLSDCELNSLERMIIKKIEKNNLNDQEQIFDDIQKSIRHKITPAKLGKLVKEQQLAHSSTPETRIIDLEKSESYFTVNTKSDLENKDDDSLVDLSQGRLRFLPSVTNNRKRRLRSVPKTRNFSKDGNEQSLQTSIASSSTDDSPQLRRMRENSTQKKTGKCPKHSVSVDCVHCELTRKRVKRNFVAENIRNAAKPRRRCDVQSLLHSNQLETSTSTPCLSVENRTKPLSPVYSFQTNSIRGSPRFWVTLSPRKNNVENRSDLKTKTKRPYKRNEKKEVRFETINQEVAEGSGNESEKICAELDVEPKPSIKSKVEQEINCLGQQIEELKPRLIQYKKTIDEYGEQISKVSHFVDDAVQLQNEIQDSRQKIKEEAIMNQYVDKVCCEVQTYSISEADD